MSDARAIAATERCRDLVANPEKVGLPRRGGLEPRDVLVKFNRAAAHTSSAFQIHVTMKLALGGEENGTPIGPFVTETALVAEGRTEAEALEMFFNWMMDENAVATFREVVMAHQAAQVDVLAEAELAKQRELEREQAKRSKEATHTWLEKKFHALGKAAGVIKDKVQLS